MVYGEADSGVPVASVEPIGSFIHFARRAHRAAGVAPLRPLDAATLSGDVADPGRISEA